MKIENGNSVIELIISIVFLFVILLISWLWKWNACSNYGELTNRDTKYTVTNGCFVEHKGKFIPRSELERRFIMSDK